MGNSSFTANTYGVRVEQQLSCHEALASQDSQIQVIVNASVFVGGRGESELIQRGEQNNTAVSLLTVWSWPMAVLDPKQALSLLEMRAAILAPPLRFDPVLHDTIAYSAPVSVWRVRVTAPNGKEEPRRVLKEDQAPDRETRWLAVL